MLLLLKMPSRRILLKCILYIFTFSVVEAKSQRFEYVKNKAVQPGLKPMLKLEARSKIECAKMILEKGFISASLSNQDVCLLYDHTEENLLDHDGMDYIFPGNILDLIYKWNIYTNSTKFDLLSHQCICNLI